MADANTKRETGRTAQIGNIQAAKVKEIKHFYLMFLLFVVKLGCIGYNSNHVRAKIHAEDVVRSAWWDRYNQ